MPAGRPTIREENKTIVNIEWKSEDDDWPWFYLIGLRGTTLTLQGADYPDGTGTHDGGVFDVDISEVKELRGVWRGKNGKTALLR